MLDPNVRIDSKRLWTRHMDMATIGATPGGGCNRQALTEADAAGRRRFMQWCEASGYTLRVDAIGNVFARRAGRDPDAPAVLTGSHLDTQPTGGRFDGIFGVLAGLEVLQTLDDHGVQTRHPLEVAIWTNEEGCRFDRAMMGSAVFAGAMGLDEAYALRDRDGVSVREALEQIGMLGTGPASAPRVRAFFEAHIEQGPILESGGHTIGVVTGVQHMSRHRLIVWGREAHAGTTPMDLRKDPVRALRDLLPALYDLAAAQGPDARLTFGFLDARPGSPNTVPGRLEITLDVRHPQMAAYAALREGMDRLIRETCTNLDLRHELTCFWSSEGLDFDGDCVASVRRAAQTLGLPARDIVSGAGHDACLLAPVVPTAMIFVPSVQGISHNEAEYSEPHWLAAGADVLLRAMVEQAL